MRRDFPGRMGEALLDTLFSELTETKLRAMPRPPAAFRAAKGKLVVHVTPANVPNPSVTSLVLGLLAGAKNAVKVSRRDAGLLRVYAESLKAHAPGLAKDVETFSSREKVLERLKEAALVVAYGDNETVKRLRLLTPKATPFIANGHRVSVAVFTKEVLTPALAKAAALDAWMVDRRGCMSPDVFLVEGGPRTAAFVSRLGREIERLHAGPVSFERALQRKAARAKDLIMALKGESASGSVPVKIFGSPRELERLLSPYRGKLQAAALEAPPRRRKALEAVLKNLGAGRICRAGRMQRPPLTWQ